MDDLNWDLATLHRAISFDSLSAASGHIGVSQSQLSRIVKKLETAFGVPLLSREVRRSGSPWTEEARRLADLYARADGQFRDGLSRLASGLTPKVLRVGALEGLLDPAVQVCERLLGDTDVQTLHLEVYDISELEEKFYQGTLDLIFTASLTSHPKHNLVRVLGYQTLDQQGAGNTAVLSPWEYMSRRRELQDAVKVFVSNSLAARQLWLKRTPGHGQLPSSVRASATKDPGEVTVLLIAHDRLGQDFFEKIAGFARP